MSYLGQQLGQGQAERFVFTASGGETSVTTSDDGRAIAYTVGQVDVYLNGAKLINGSDFTATTGTSITGLAALTASDVVEVFALSIFQASDTVSAASGGTFNGNITINADLTVDTNTLYVDSANNRVGIGTSSPATPLDVTTAGGGNFVATFQNTTAATPYGVSIKEPASAANGYPSFQITDSAGTSVRLRVDSGTGNVGIGTASPGGHRLKVEGGTAYLLDHLYIAGGLGKMVSSDSASNPLIFGRNASEDMRIDSSGNLLVGTTTANPTSAAVNTPGVELSTTGGVRSTVTSDPAATFNRKTDDGPVVLFRKDGTTVGSIGTGSGAIYIGSGSQSSGVSFYGTALYPNNGGSISATNGANDIGAPTARWKDLYLSGGVYLGGTGAANKLDDYEEGTYTPVLEFGGTASGMSWSTREGKYTKVGNLVTVMVYMYTPTGRGAQTGIATLTLPFASDSAQPDHWVPLSNRNGIGAGTGKTLTAYISTNTPYFIFYAGDDAGGSNNSLTHAYFSTSGLLEISIIFQYRTA